MRNWHKISWLHVIRCLETDAGGKLQGSGCVENVAGKKKSAGKKKAHFPTQKVELKQSGLQSLSSCSMSAGTPLVADAATAFYCFDVLIHHFDKAHRVVPPSFANAS